VLSEAAKNRAVKMEMRGRINRRRLRREKAGKGHADHAVEMVSLQNFLEKILRDPRIRSE